MALEFNYSKIGLSPIKSNHTYIMLQHAGMHIYIPNNKYY
jgi:hypothetical protein